MAPPGVTWEEIKTDRAPKADDSYAPDDEGTELKITITKASGQEFDWTSNFDMAAVFVKGGTGGGGVLYRYDGDDDRSDTGLHALPHEIVGGYHGISHVSFCYLAGTVVTSTTATTPTTASTPITASTPTTAAVTPAPEAPAAVAPAAEGVNTTVLGETLVAGDTLPRTGAAINMLGPRRRAGPGLRPDDAHARPSQDRNPQQLIGRTPRGGCHAVPAPQPRYRY